MSRSRLVQNRTDELQVSTRLKEACLEYGVAAEALAIVVRRGCDWPTCKEVFDLCERVGSDYEARAGRGGTS